MTDEPVFEDEAPEDAEKDDEVTADDEDEEEVGV